MDLFTQAKNSKNTLDVALDGAFAFLVSEFKYCSDPISFGPSHFRAFTKTFSCEDRCIEFSLDYDRRHGFELLFHPINMRARSALHPSIRYLPSWHFSLRDALRALGLKVELADNCTAVEVAPQFAALLRQYGTDLIRGDFSVFPEISFDVNVVDKSTDNWSVRSLGVFEDFRDAEKCAVANLELLQSVSVEHVEVVGRSAAPVRGR